MDRALLEEALEVALAAVRAAAPGILRAFRDPQLERERKPDGTLVTAADRAAELELRAALRAPARLAGIGVLGEEHGAQAGAGALRWVVDPIDGTISFARGVPAFGTLVALEELATGRALLGVIHLPALGETTWAARGLGAFRDGAPIRVSDTDGDALREALVSVPDSGWLRRAECGAAFGRLLERCDHVRSLGDCYAHALAARGAIDAVWDPGLAPWDLRATEAVVEEAGGRVLTRPSKLAGKRDLLCGAPALVERLAALLEFEPAEPETGQARW